MCDLTTEAIASAFLTTPSTLAQRIVRAKSKIRDAGIPFDVPSREDLPDRIDSVLQVIYLVFNEGYAASSGESLTRPDLSGEAIRLGRLLVELLPEPEVIGLLALMLLHESRRAARTSPTGEIDPARRAGPHALEPRADCRRQGARRASAVVATDRPLYASSRNLGRACRCRQLPTRPTGVRSSRCTTCWRSATPSPIVELNRAVAIAMRDGPAAGLSIIDAILARGDLADYHLAHAARADMFRRLGQRRRRPRRLPAGTGTDPAGARAAVSRAPPGRIGLKKIFSAPVESGVRQATIHVSRKQTSNSRSRRLLKEQEQCDSWSSSKPPKIPKPA